MALFEQLTDAHKHTMMSAPPTQAFVHVTDSLIQDVCVCVCPPEMKLLSMKNKGRESAGRHTCRIFFIFTKKKKKPNTVELDGVCF